jgi:CubicO group peptidase (beta-lactamase class C family)
MSNIRLLTVSIALLALCAASCSIEITVPPDTGFDSERLERIDRAINEAIAKQEIPGAVTLIVKDGKTVYHKAFGYADIQSKTAMETDTIFRIASMTKAVTSVGVMILYEQGHFLLNDPVSKFIPEFADMQVISEVGDDGSVVATVPAKAQIRIIDLLSHTSGITYPFFPGKLQKTYVESGVIDGLTASERKLENQIKLLAQQPLLFEPGTEFAYGLSIDVLGYLIEVISGQPLDEFFAKNITGPLGMVDTYFYLPAEKSSRLATLYAEVAEQGLIVSEGTEADIKLDNPNYPIEGARSYFSGGAGLSSTAQDYARLIEMLLNEGELDGTRILSRKSVELMRTPRIDWDGDDIPDFGLGFSVVSDIGKRGELASVGNLAWGGAYYTSYWIDPSESLVAVFMSQGRPISSDIDNKFKVLVYQALN